MAINFNHVADDIGTTLPFYSVQRFVYWNLNQIDKWAHTHLSLHHVTATHTTRHKHNSFWTNWIAANACDTTTTHNSRSLSLFRCEDKLIVVVQETRPSDWANSNSRVSTAPEHHTHVDVIGAAKHHLHSRLVLGLRGRRRHVATGTRSSARRSGEPIMLNASLGSEGV